MEESNRLIEMNENSSNYVTLESDNILPLNPNEHQSPQRTCCEALCCGLCAKSNNENQNNEKSGCGLWWWIFLAFCCCFLTAYCVFLTIQLQTVHMQLRHINRLLDNQYSNNSLTHGQIGSRIDDLGNKFHHFESKVQSKFVTFDSNFNDVDEALKDQRRELWRLSKNGTSNADVLDVLASTKSDIQSRLEAEHNQLFTALEGTTRNVTMQMTANNRDLKDTRHHIESRLNATAGQLTTIVGNAASHLQEVQSNVTTQLDTMTSNVQRIIIRLREEVKEAEATIHQDMSSVQSNIDKYVAVTNKQFAAENDFVKYQLAGTFTLLGCLISLWHMTSHWRHYEKPEVQRRIMAVLWMVPIYGITSWLSLVMPKRAEPWLSSIRDCYEAYVIYTFIALLIAVLGDGRSLQGVIDMLAHRVVEERDAVLEYERLLSQQAPFSMFRMFNVLGYRDATPTTVTALPPRPTEHITPPCPCCYRSHRPQQVAAAWLYQCQLMAMQFVILRPLLTIVPLILQCSGVVNVQAIPMYDTNGQVNWMAPNLYILAAQNISVMIAFTGLMCFYHGTEKELEWCNPWPKFLCIKGVVFCTFWQSLTIQMFCAMGRMDERTATQTQNLLICIEMLLASVAHFYIFPYQEWEVSYKKEKQRSITLKETMALSDLVKDMRLMVTSWHADSEDPYHPTNVAELEEEERQRRLVEREGAESELDHVILLNTADGSNSEVCSIPDTSSPSHLSVNAMEAGLSGTADLSSHSGGNDRGSTSGDRGGSREPSLGANQGRSRATTSSSGMGVATDDLAALNARKTQLHQQLTDMINTQLSRSRSSRMSTYGGGGGASGSGSLRAPSTSGIAGIPRAPSLAPEFRNNSIRSVGNSPYPSYGQNYSSSGGDLNLSGGTTMSYDHYDRGSASGSGSSCAGPSSDFRAPLVSSQSVRSSRGSNFFGSNRQSTFGQRTDNENTALLGHSAGGEPFSPSPRGPSESPSTSASGYGAYGSGWRTFEGNSPSHDEREHTVATSAALASPHPFSTSLHYHPHASQPPTLPTIPSFTAGGESHSDAEDGGPPTHDDNQGRAARAAHRNQHRRAAMQHLATDLSEGSESEQSKEEDVNVFMDVGTPVRRSSPHFFSGGNANEDSSHSPSTKRHPSSASGSSGRGKNTGSSSDAKAGRLAHDDDYESDKSEYAI